MSRIGNLLEIENGLFVTWARKGLGGNGEGLLKGMGFLFGVMKML